jgi:hypothetical protein
MPTARQELETRAEKVVRDHVRAPVAKGRSTSCHLTNVILLPSGDQVGEAYPSVNRTLLADASEVARTVTTTTADAAVVRTLRRCPHLTPTR